MGEREFIEIDGKKYFKLNPDQIQEVKTENTTYAITTAICDEDNEEIVFASSPFPKRKIKPKLSNKFSAFVAPIIAIMCACFMIAVCGIVFTWQRNNHFSYQQPTAAILSGQDNTQISDSFEDPLIQPMNTNSIVFGKNVTVNGMSVSNKTMAQIAKLMQGKVKMTPYPIVIQIKCKDKELTLTQDDFEYELNTADVILQAYHYSRGETKEITVRTIRSDYNIDFPIDTVLKKNAIDVAMKKISDTFEVQPMNAHVEQFNPEETEKFIYVNGHNGFLFDKDSIKKQLDMILNSEDKMGIIYLTLNEVPFKTDLQTVKANTKLIASHYTTAANVWASNYNMELAIKSANGTIVKPGEIFSFNGMTGDTTTGDLGYVPSTAIVGGEYMQQYGGGICQASTTLYICALKADMEPVERWAHAYPSIYADRGLDATVDYGNLDMKFKNTKEFSIYIATYVYDYNGDGMDELLVEMYGPPSDEYDEIVPVGWVSDANDYEYTASAAKVYFKDGKEVKRKKTIDGSYGYRYDYYYSVLDMMPEDKDFGPKEVTPTLEPPQIFSPNGVGSSAPVAYQKKLQWNDVTRKILQIKSQNQ